MNLGIGKKFSLNDIPLFGRKLSMAEDSTNLHKLGFPQRSSAAINTVDVPHITLDKLTGMHDPAVLQ